MSLLQRCFFPELSRGHKSPLTRLSLSLSLILESTLKKERLIQAVSNELLIIRATKSVALIFRSV